MFGIYRYVRSHRRSAFTRFAARQCRRFIECYENGRNYDMQSNGERFVLSALSGQGFQCILDVGANVGDWSRLASSMFPAASVHAFEVVPETAGELTRRMHSLANVTVNAFGLSDCSAEVEVRCFAGYDTLSSIVHVPHEIPSVIRHGQVTTGDDYLQRSGIERVDLLKVDVEGAEGLVLRGFERSLDQQRVDVIQFEYGTGSILNKFLLRDFYLYLEPKGYTLGKIYPDYVEFRAYDVSHEDFLGPNYLAVRRDRPDLLKLLS